MIESDFIRLLKAIATNQRFQILKALWEYKEATYTAVWRKVASESNSGTIASDMQRLCILGLMEKRKTFETNLNINIYTLSGKGVRMITLLERLRRLLCDF